VESDVAIYAWSGDQLHRGHFKLSLKELHGQSNAEDNQTCFVAPHARWIFNYMLNNVLPIHLSMCLKIYTGVPDLPHTREGEMGLQRWHWTLVCPWWRLGFQFLPPHLLGAGDELQLKYGLVVWDITKFTGMQTHSAIEYKIMWSC